MESLSSRVQPSSRDSEVLPSPCVFLSRSSVSVQTPTDDGIPTKHSSTRKAAKRKRKGRRLEVLELREQVASYKQMMNDLLLETHDETKDGQFWYRTAHRITLEKRLAVRENLRLRTLIEQKMKTIQSIVNMDHSKVRPPQR